MISSSSWTWTQFEKAMYSVFVSDAFLMIVSAACLNRLTVPLKTFSADCVREFDDARRSELMFFPSACGGTPRLKRMIVSSLS